MDRRETYLILLDIMMPGIDGITAMTRSVPSASVAGGAFRFIRLLL